MSYNLPTTKHRRMASAELSREYDMQE